MTPKIITCKTPEEFVEHMQPFVRPFVGDVSTMEYAQCPICKALQLTNAFIVNTDGGYTCISCGEFIRTICVPTPMFIIRELGIYRVTN